MPIAIATWTPPAPCTFQVSVEAVRLLITRGVSGIGADAMSVDCGASKTRRAPISLGAGLYQLENLADLQTLPEAGAF